jgi:hypothetical protein
MALPGVSKGIHGADFITTRPLLQHNCLALLVDGE